MDEISQFRGYSGEVVRLFLKFSTFLTIIPLIAFWLGIYFVMYLMGNKLPTIVFFLVNLLAISFLLARFTIPACEGEFDAGFFSPHISSGQTGSFILRYLIYMFAWMIPVFLLSKYVLNVNSLFSMLLFSSSSISASSSFHSLIALIVFLAIIFGPTFSCLLAAITSSFEEVLSLEPIMWLLGDRRKDLGSFYAAAFGGLLIFYVKYIIPLSILNILIYKSSFESGLAFSYFISILPFLVSPIIIGRLTGAFVAGELPLAERIENTNSPYPSQPTTPSAGINNGDEQESDSWADLKNRLNELLPRLEKMSASDLDEEVEYYESMEASNVHVQLALTHLYYHQKKHQNALAQAKKAIKSALKNGMGFEAVTIFQMFKEDKSKLELDTKSKVSLGAYLTNQQYFMDAAWCYMMAIASAETEDDKLDIQKKFIEMADKASRANETALAYKLYQLFLKHCPDSTLADFVADQANVLELRLNNS